jgi:hypothetical protein
MQPVSISKAPLDRRLDLVSWHAAAV